MSAPSLSNVFSDVYITGNCTVKGTISSLAGSITSQWTTSGSTIYYSTGNVGIGTATPAYALDVWGGQVRVVGNPFLVQEVSATPSIMRITTGGDGKNYIQSGTALTSGSSADLIFGTIFNASQFLTIKGTTGYVGIGTTNPGSLLTVSGGVGIGSGYNAFTAPTGGLIVQGNVGIGTSNPGVNALQVTGNVVTSGFTSNATNTVFNYDTLTVPFVVATQIASTSTAPLQITSNVDLGTGTMTTATVISSTGLMFRNRIINGDFRLDQRNGGASFTPTVVGKTYTLDRWWGWIAVASKFSVQRSTEVPVGQGFTNSVLVTSLSAYSTPVGGYYGFGQYIEGYNIADMGFGTASAKTASLSFWARSSIAGTFSVALENGSFNRSYIFNYTISSVNTWQYFTLPFTADTTGTWDSTTGQGLRIWWDLGSNDTTYAGAAGSWLAADRLRTTGSVSLIGTNAATLYIAGAQLEKGSAATPFEFRPFAIELTLCQRYYEKSFDITVAPVANSFGNNIVIATSNTGSTYQVGLIPFKVTKRVSSGTVSIYNPFNAVGVNTSLRVPSGGDVNITSSSATVSGININMTAQPAALSYHAHFTYDGEL